MTDEIITIRKVSDLFGLDLGEGALVNILDASTKPFAAAVAAINEPRRSTEWSLCRQSGRGASDLLVTVWAPLTFPICTLYREIAR